MAINTIHFKNPTGTGATLLPDFIKKLKITRNMEKLIVTLEATRTDYSAKEAARHTMTVGELITYLEQYDEETPVVFSNDNGYTYGNLDAGTVGDVEVEED